MSSFATAHSRACHWVLKIGSLKASMAFFENVLGLRVLRHEEFATGCEATCNGPYGGAWSKTMIGYGPEKSNFALELTYNYGIESYAFGNDLLYIALQCPGAIARARALGYVVEDGDVIVGPDSYRFKIVAPIAKRAEMFVCVALRVKSLANSLDFWLGTLHLTQFSTLPSPQIASSFETACVGFIEEGEEAQVCLQFIEVKDGVAEVDHALSSGRVAFACKKVEPIFQEVTARGDVVQVPPLTLPTEGKADVVVTILVDRDGYEICFVEDEAFYALATPLYDVIDFEERATRGGDGAPPPASEALGHEEGGAIVLIESVDELQEELDKAAAAAGGGGKSVFVEFGAGWCKNCKRLAPFVEAQAKKTAGSITVLLVDIDKAAEIAMEHDVSNVPRILVFKGNDKVDDYLGSSEAEIEALFTKHA